MNCPNCKSEMSKGLITNGGRSWVATNIARGGFLETMGAKSLESLVAWKCQTCNKIELTIESTTSPTRG